MARNTKRCIAAKSTSVKHLKIKKQKSVDVRTYKHTRILYNYNIKTSIHGVYREPDNV